MNNWKNSLTNDIFFIDSQIRNSTTNCNDMNKYYYYCDTYNDEIIKIFNILKLNLKKINPLITDHLNFLKKFKLKFKEEIKDEKDYVIFQISYSILRSFTDISHINKENNINDIYKSDSIITSASKSIENFKIWLNISYNINNIIKETDKLCQKKNRKLVFMCFTILIVNKLIKEQKKTIKNKSQIFYLLKCKIKDYIYLEMYETPFKIYRENSEIWIYINHHSNVYNITKKNSFSDKIIDFPKDHSFLNNILDISAYIDFDLLEDHFNERLEIQKIRKDELYDNINILLNEINKARLTNDNNSSKEFCKIFTEICDLIRINEILRNKKNILYYFPMILCFRGRIYYTSSISFTYYKEIRYCLHKGEYEINEKPNFHYLCKTVNDEIDKHVIKLDRLINYKFDKFNKDIIRSVLWIMVSIADIKKKKLGESIELDRFIEHGIDIVNDEKRMENLDVYEKLKLKSLIKTLEEISKNIHIKRLISKDATASVFQHLIKILGYNSIESLKKCNLYSKNTWYDTYQYILDKWKTDENLKNNEIVNKYFTRKTVKKTIMTSQYGAKFPTCWKYFIENIQNIDELDELKKYFKKFYEFVNNDIGILENNSKSIPNKLKDLNFTVITEDNCKSDLNYLKQKKGQIKIIHEGFIKTKSLRNNLTVIDLIKTKSSSRANYIHVLDSAVVRYIVSIIPILTIHDCFLIDPRNISFLIALVNEAMRKTFHELKIEKKIDPKDIFSIFILI